MIQSFSSAFTWLRFFICFILCNLLSGCYEWSDWDWISDPVCCNQTPPEPSLFWVPNQFCPLIRCENEDGDNLDSLVNKKLDLVDLIDIALRNNPTTQVTWADARAAAYQVGMAESELYPSIDLQETLTYENIQFDDGNPAAATLASTDLAIINDIQNGQQQLGILRQQAGQDAGLLGNAGPGNTNVILNSNLSISYLLLDFGGRCAAIKAAREALYISDWLHNRQIQEVIVSVLQSYYNYQGLKDLLKARYSDLENAQVSLNAAQQLFESGIRTKLDVLQTQSDLVNIELDIVNLKGQIQIALGTLITDIGVPAHFPIDIVDLSDDTPLDQISKNIDELIATGIEQRPDLAAAYANQEQKRAEVTIARSAGLPTITTNLNIESNIYFHNPSFNNRVYSGNVALNIPLFSGFFYLNQTRRAQEFLRAAAADVRGRELGVILDVITSYYNFKTAIESYRFSEKYLTYSQEAYAAATISYREGIGTILDLLAAERTLANAKAQKVQARTNWLIALANIAFATGVLGLE